MADSLRTSLGRFLGLRGGRLALALALAFGVLLVGLRMSVSLYVDLLWFRSVGYEGVLLRRLAWAWGARLGVGAAVALVLFLNLRLVVSTLGAIRIKRRFGNIEIAEQLPRGYIVAAAAALSAVVGLWFGGSVIEGVGIQGLLAATAPAWGVRDPVFGLDLSFYVFQLPLLRTAMTFAMVVVFLVFTVCVGGYAATGVLRWGKGGLVMADLPRVHLGGLLASFLVLVALRLWVGRYLLLLYGTSDVQGIFGFTDAQARLPALRAMSLVTLGAAVALFWGAWTNRAVPVIAGVVAVAAGGILGVEFYPSLVQRFRVEPNELAREAPYIEMNLDFTRAGFGLDDLRRERFHYAPPEGIRWARIEGAFDGLPVWSGNALLKTFQQVEARFRYYDFSDVNVDRYPASTGTEMVSVAVREVDPTGIEDQNWQNLHLRERYLAGMGVVASDASDRTPEGRPPMFVSGIPPEFQPRPDAPEGLRLRNASVYFGGRSQPYAILNPGPDAFLAPDSTPGMPGVDYPEGIPLSSALRTASFAWDLGEPNLLFAGEVGRDSRIVIHRQVTRRVEEIFPYFRYPEAPYPVVYEGRVVWILDGFTVTRSFPLASPQQFAFNRQLAYVRNSVRVTIDAVTGEVGFYRLPGADPLLEAYDRAFPGLLRSFDTLPAGLRRHLRYSKRLLDLQAQVLRQYHQDTPQQFHAQQDVWATPTELAEGQSPVPYQSEFGLWRLPGEEEESFLLSTVFVPLARQNLTAILAGRVDEDGVRRLFLFDVPVEDQAPGPRQVEALVEQDPIISQQFSLWRSGGSEVWTGHLHILPYEDHLLFMEPIFLAAEADAIPELRRFVVSDGRSVVMEPTLAEALAAFGGDRSEARPPPGIPSVRGSREMWPAEALDLLERAEGRLRAGDWPGFGTALEELGDLLRRLATPEAGGDGEGASPSAEGAGDG